MWVIHQYRGQAFVCLSYRAMSHRVVKCSYRAMSHRVVKCSYRAMSHRVVKCIYWFSSLGILPCFLCGTRTNICAMYFQKNVFKCKTHLLFLIILVESVRRRLALANTLDSAVLCEIGTTRSSAQWLWRGSCKAFPARLDS